MLLFPVQFNKTTTNPSNGRPEVESSFPIGLILAPAIAGGNLLMANSANENLKKELLDYNLIGKTIKKGETVYGLIGLKSTGYESLKLRIQ